MLKRRALLTAAASASAIGATWRWGFATASSGAAPFRAVLLGDCLFTQGIIRDDAELRRFLPLLRGADVAVANFEGTLADEGNWASSIDPGGTPICGGLNVRGDASVASDLSWLGIDMVGTANNHAMDWGPAGLQETNKKLSAAGIQHAGTGSDLSEARRPAYFNPHGSQTALISCTSTYWPGALASHGDSSILGRPGVNPIRIVARGGGAGSTTAVDPGDLQDILNSIRDAKRSAERVFVSCHTHESEGNGDGDRDLPPTFLKELARACIAAGTDAFFSHGPHVLRGVEIYNGRPIFYSLGAFIFRARETRALPAELFENCQMTSRDPIQYFERTSREWVQDVEFWQSMIAEVQFDRDKVTQVRLIPTVIRHDEVRTWGMPELADAEESQAILVRVSRLSAPYGTIIELDGLAGRIRIHSE
jgi:hypothetical protein